MAKIIKGILGEVSGLVGSVVGAVVRGVATIRSRPKKSTKPPVQSQVNQRTKFGIATDFITSAKRVVDIGFQSYKNRMSPSNAAVQDLLNNAITGVAPNFKIDYPNVTLSKGSLPDSPSMKLLPPVAGAQLVVTWNPVELGEEDALVYGQDLTVFMVYDEDANRFLFLVRAASREAGRRELDLPYFFVGDKLHVWVFFVSPDGKSVSTSQYLGSGIAIP
ncbi:DUF6266 family protein [Pedobacter hartonius]|uniref:Uncharacterized protein n=1 Tax=Pedobacter hartonius TaxID=425514 RepID=A0A1H3WD07_9SPHI|nr:DUF6266 family protein [Pedobacter hartonius]SDZ84840.1 hypothetical protein SAMN05443550_101195 [Pedobacter hartonius]